LTLNRQALALARAQDGEQGVWAIEVGIALVLAYLGDLETASAQIDEVLARDDPLVVEFVQLPACVIDLERADLKTASQRLERLQVVPALGVADFTVGVLLARARWHYLSGEHGRVLETAADARTVTGDVFEPSRVEMLVVTMRSARALADDATADRTRETLDHAVALGGGRGFQAAATWAHGLATARHGSFADASTLLSSAAELFAGAQRFVHAADAWLDLAEIAAANGNDEIRLRALARARQIAEPRGLASVLARIPEPRAHDGEGSADTLRSLSTRERQIAGLVANGKTNREIAAVLFISEHTVRNQLVNVFAKLGISRRAELAGLATGSAQPDRGQSGHRSAP
jgi:DNA-binding CsgD family transcriptional regulator